MTGAATSPSSTSSRRGRNPGRSRKEGADVIPAIILAGGRGTRLAAAVSDVPKPMAPNGAQPFLERVIAHLRSQGITELVLSIGHKGEVIDRHFGSSWHGMRIRDCAERVPLGTGGAMRKAM